MDTVKTICVDAKKNDIEVHHYINYVSGFAQSRQDKLINMLSFSDLKKIESVQLPNERLDNNRKWMIIGFWLGQRVPDLLSLTTLDIRSAPYAGLYVAYFKGIQKFYALYCRINSWPLFTFPALKTTL